MLMIPRAYFKNYKKYHVKKHIDPNMSQSWNIL